MFIITSFSMNSSNLLRRWRNSGRKIGSSCQQMFIKWCLAKTTTRSFSWLIFGNFLHVPVISWWKVNCFQIELYHSVNFKLSSMVTSNTTSKSDTALKVIGRLRKVKTSRAQGKSTSFFLYFFLEPILFRAQGKVEVMTLKLLWWSIRLYKTVGQWQYFCLKLNLVVRF